MIAALLAFIRRRFRWEHDTWYWEDLGVNEHGWYFGHWSHVRPLPEWLRWLPQFNVRFPDKVGHAVVHLALTLLLARWSFWAAVVVPPIFGLWYELRGWASWKDIVANTVGWGLALAILRCRL